MREDRRLIVLAHGREHRVELGQILGVRIEMRVGLPRRHAAVERLDQRDGSSGQRPEDLAHDIARPGEVRRRPIEEKRHVGTDRARNGINLGVGGVDLPKPCKRHDNGSRIGRRATQTRPHGNVLIDQNGKIGLAAKCLAHSHRSTIGRVLLHGKISLGDRAYHKILVK